MDQSDNQKNSEKSGNEAKESKEISNLLLLEKLESLNKDLNSFKNVFDECDEIKSLEIEKQMLEIKLELQRLKSYFVISYVSFFVLMSWGALLGTGSWWKWFSFLSFQ